MEQQRRLMIYRQNDKEKCRARHNPCRLHQVDEAIVGAAQGIYLTIATQAANCHGELRFAMPLFHHLILPLDLHSDPATAERYPVDREHMQSGEGSILCYYQLQPSLHRAPTVFLQDPNSPLCMQSAKVSLAHSQLSPSLHFFATGIEQSPRIHQHMPNTMVSFRVFRSLQCLYFVDTTVGQCPRIPGCRPSATASFHLVLLLPVWNLDPTRASQLPSVHANKQNAKASFRSSLLLQGVHLGPISGG